MGVDLGSNLLQPMKGVNDKGFWEDIDVNHLNVEMLRALDIDWHNVAPPADGYVEILRERGFLLRAVSLLRDKTKSVSCFGFKDPRVTQLLGFWNVAFSMSSLSTGYVLAIRHPVSVARSLAQRDNFDTDKSMFLWSAYTMNMLVETAGKPNRIVVDYDRLLENPMRELRRMATALDREIDPIELSPYLDEFLDRKLQHHIYSGGTNSEVQLESAIAQNLYEILLAASSDAIALDELVISEPISTWSNNLARWRRPLEWIDKLYATNSFALRELSDRGVQVTQLHRELVAKEEQATTATEALNQQKLSEAAATLAIRNRDDEIEALKQALHEKSIELASLGNALSNLNKVTAEKEKQICDLGDALRIQTNEVSKLSRQISTLEDMAREERRLTLLRDLELLAAQNSIATAQRVILEQQAESSAQRAHTAEWKTRVMGLSRIIVAQLVRPREAKYEDHGNRFPELTALLNKNGRQFLESAFFATHGYALDLNTETEAKYMDKLRAGASKKRILSAMFRAARMPRGLTSPKGLRRLIAIHTLSQIPIVGLLIPTRHDADSESVSAIQLRALRFQVCEANTKIDACFHILIEDLEADVDINVDTASV
jgi:hypothetical protein